MKIPAAEHEEHLQAPSILCLPPASACLTLALTLEHTIVGEYCIGAPRHPSAQTSPLTPGAGLASGDLLLALGLGSLFNHSSTPNIHYQTDSDALRIRYYAARDIAAGEELTFFYNPTEQLKFADAEA